MAALHSPRCIIASIAHLTPLKTPSKLTFGVLPAFHLNICRTSVRMDSSEAGGCNMTSVAAEVAGNSDTSDVLVQYVVLRRDLIDTWPLGSVVTQGCHASVAAIWSNKDDPHTLDYCSPTNVDSMHKASMHLFIHFADSTYCLISGPIFSSHVLNCLKSMDCVNSSQV